MSPPRETTPIQERKRSRSSRWRSARRHPLLKKRAPIPDGGVVVVVHGGEYRVTQTFILAAEDSGTSNHRLFIEPPRAKRLGSAEASTWAASSRFGTSSLEPTSTGVGGESPRTRPEDRRGNHLMPLVLGGFASGRGFGTHPAHEVFFNGKALRLARGPNEGFLRVADVAVKDGTKGYDRQGSKTGKFFYQGDLPKRWVGEPDLLLYGYWFWDWADSYERVAGIDPEKRLITLAEPYHTYGYSVGAPFYALNALSELDLPGEYYLDRRNLRLFLYPPSDPATATVDLSLFPGPMARLENVSHARFERLTWELGCGDGIIVAGGSNCLFAGCVVRRLAGNGVESMGAGDTGCFHAISTPWAVAEPSSAAATAPRSHRGSTSSKTATFTTCHALIIPIRPPCCSRESETGWRITGSTTC